MKKKFQKVADYLNDAFGCSLIGEQIEASNLPSNLLMEIKTDGYTDTCQRELLIEHISIQIVGMRWPCFGDSQEVKDKFDKLAKEKGLIR